MALLTFATPLGDGMEYHSARKVAHRAQQDRDRAVDGMPELNAGFGAVSVKSHSGRFDATGGVNFEPVVTLSRFLYQARLSRWSRSIQTLRAGNPRADLRRHAQRARGTLDFDVDN